MKTNSIFFSLISVQSSSHMFNLSKLTWSLEPEEENIEYWESPPVFDRAEYNSSLLIINYKVGNFHGRLGEEDKQVKIDIWLELCQIIRLVIWAM